VVRLLPLKPLPLQNLGYFVNHAEINRMSARNDKSSVIRLMLMIGIFPKTKILEKSIFFKKEWNFLNVSTQKKLVL